MQMNSNDVGLFRIQEGDYDHSVASGQDDSDSHSDSDESCVAQDTEDALLDMMTGKDKPRSARSSPVRVERQEQTGLPSLSPSASPSASASPPAPPAPQQSEEEGGDHNRKKPDPVKLAHHLSFLDKVDRNIHALRTAIDSRNILQLQTALDTVSQADSAVRDYLRQNLWETDELLTHGARHKYEGCSGLEVGSIVFV